jgi:hypothetical protein
VRKSEWPVDGQPTGERSHNSGIEGKRCGEAPLVVLLSSIERVDQVDAGVEYILRLTVNAIVLYGDGTFPLCGIGERGAIPTGSLKRAYEKPSLT